MTGKSLQNEVTRIVNVFIKAKGLNPEIGTKGGQREIAQSLVGMSLIEHADQILLNAGLTAEQIKDARAAVAIDDAADRKDLKIAKTA